MKLLFILLFLVSCSADVTSLKKGDCVYAKYPYLSGLQTEYGKVVETFDDNEFALVENTKGYDKIAERSYLYKTSCKAFNLLTKSQE